MMMVAQPCASVIVGHGVNALGYTLSLSCGGGGGGYDAVVSGQRPISSAMEGSPATHCGRHWCELREACPGTPSEAHHTVAPLDALLTSVSARPQSAITT